MTGDLALVELEMEKTDRFEEKLAEFSDRVEQTVTLIMREIYEIIMNIAPVKTGELRISHQWTVLDNEGFLMNPVEYLQWVIRGRGYVYPVEKKALYWPELKHPVAYAGPAPPNDYLSAAVAYVDATGIIEDTFEKWVIE